VNADTLKAGPITAVINQPVQVANLEGREFSGSVTDASSRQIAVTYTTGHKGQFSQTRLFRRSTLRGHDEGWSVRPGALLPA
jgi:hypothetical protein